MPEIAEEVGASIVADAALAVTPRLMSTQHPDNVAMPIFASGDVMTVDDEVKEAFYAYAHLGCDEQMWDFEGKEVDNSVVQKLLSSYEPFFRTHVLGEQLRLTPRVPNPRLERAQAKGLLEVLHSLPRHTDAARLFYGGSVCPIYEVIFPMTTSAVELARIRAYYALQVAGAGALPLVPGDIELDAWCGSFEPTRVSVIPLLEDITALLGAGELVDQDLAATGATSQRVFIARSDPALNYGHVAAVLLSLIALDQLHQVQQRRGVSILPIIGCGSAPFRGGLRPTSIDQVLATYPSVQTFTIQSAFKFDNPPSEVRAALDRLKAAPRLEPRRVAADVHLRVIVARASERYRAEIRELSPMVNAIAPFIPRRRLRKLHIGLFGYSRDDERADVSLPRAITFCAALYTIGLAPEAIGLAALSGEDWERVCKAVPDLPEQIAAGLAHSDPELDPTLPPLTRESVTVARARCEVEIDMEHAHLARRAREAMRDREHRLVSELATIGGSLRHFLG